MHVLQPCLIHCHRTQILACLCKAKFVKFMRAGFTSIVFQDRIFPYHRNSHHQNPLRRGLSSLVYRSSKVQTKDMTRKYPCSVDCSMREREREKERTETIHMYSNVDGSQYTRKGRTSKRLHRRNRRLYNDHRMEYSVSRIYNDQTAEEQTRDRTQHMVG